MNKLIKTFEEVGYHEDVLAQMCKGYHRYLELNPDSQLTFKTYQLYVEDYLKGCPSDVLIEGESK